MPHGCCDASDLMSKHHAPARKPGQDAQCLGEGAVSCEELVGKPEGHLAAFAQCALCPGELPPNVISKSLSRSVTCLAMVMYCTILPSLVAEFDSAAVHILKSPNVHQGAP